MLKSLLTATAILLAMSLPAFAEDPVELTAEQMDGVTAAGSNEVFVSIPQSTPQGPPDNVVLHEGAASTATIVSPQNPGGGSITLVVTPGANMVIAHPGADVLHATSVAP